MRGKISIASLALALAAAAIALALAASTAIAAGSAPAVTASAIAHTPASETLQGNVDPAGDPVTNCRFAFEPVANEVQIVTLSGATSGTFTLSFEGKTSEPISFHAKAEDIRKFALGSVFGFSAEKPVSIFGPPGGPYRFEFTGSLKQTNVPLFTADSSHLGPPGAAATVTTETQGGGDGKSFTEIPCEADSPLPYGVPTQVSAEATGLQFATKYHFHLLAENANGPTTSSDQGFTTLPLAPEVEIKSGQAFAETALIFSQVNPGGGATTYRVEYVTQSRFENEGGFEHAQSTAELPAGSARVAQQLTAHLTGLLSSTKYHYRLVATNASSPPGGTIGAERTFTTLPFQSEVPEGCPNARVRQQTSAIQLLDCRAYELVSAGDAAGYDVESSLIPGQSPFAGYPQADGHVLYGVHSGGIPGTNHPTNRGVDPYVATRGEEGWSTKYVGIPADEPFSAAPYSSTPSGADAKLETFAFGAPGGCSPCFPGGYTGIPLRLPNGELVQGMVGSENPGPVAKDGLIAKSLSADGSHLIFGSTSLFAEGGNDETGDVSIYDRNLKTGETHVVSNQPLSEDFPAALKCVQGAGECHSPGDANGIAELDVSSNGSRILLGQKVSEDAEGNAYYHLYMNVNDGISSIDLTPGVLSEPGGPGFTDGVLYDGMNADGSEVFFTSSDALTGDDGDTSVDLYRADVTGVGGSLNRISTGSAGAGNTDACEPSANTVHTHWNTTDPKRKACDVVAVGGGGGVSSGDGTIYFLSPEMLDGPANGVHNAPNLYLARPNEAPRYVTTLESDANASLPPTEHRLQRSFGTFETPSGVAVSNVAGERGDIYVLDLTNQEGKGFVEKFDPAGNLVTAFGTGGKINGKSESSPAFAEFKPGNVPTGIAVDNDPTSVSYGDLYVPNLFEEIVQKFSPTGAFEGSFSVGFPTGVAVDPSTGEVYVTELFGGVHVFDDEGTELRSFPTIEEPTGVGVGADGTVYVVNGGGLGGTGGETQAYDSVGNPLHSLAAGSSIGVTVDPEDGHVYVDESGQVAEFNSAGDPVGVPSGSDSLLGSIGLAVQGGELYVSNRGLGPATGSIAKFGPAERPFDPETDNPLVVDSVSSPATRHTADFQVSPSGEDAAFPSTLPLGGKGEETGAHSEVYRFHAPAGELACVSCTLSGFPSAGDASLASNGLSLTDDGRVFFTSRDPLLAFDTDQKQDVYEWEPLGAGSCDESNPNFSEAENACLALVSAGTSSFDSGLLSASANATDVYFFTRDSLAAQDENGPTMKIYDARVEGGFFYEYPAVSCRASDECHGAASPAPGPLKIGSSTVTPPATPSACKKGYVKRHGRCVKKRRPHRHHKHTHHRRGGRK